MSCCKTYSVVKSKRESYSQLKMDGKMFVNLSGLFRTDYESILKRGLFVFLKHFCKDRRVINCIDLRK